MIRTLPPAWIGTGWKAMFAMRGWRPPRTICSRRRISGSRGLVSGVMAVGMPFVASMPRTRSPPEVFTNDDVSARNSEYSEWALP
jgi:hypothetical protein